MALRCIRSTASRLSALNLSAMPACATPLEAVSQAVSLCGRSASARTFTASAPVVRRVGKKVATDTPLPYTHTTIPDEAKAAIVEAQYKIFGVVQGNGQRSGRKWLRQLLRGPKSKNWYGYSVRDLLPEYLTPAKEEISRSEEAMQRLGKSRIKGKVKPELMETVDQLKFESKIKEAIEEVVEVDFTEFLLEHEIEAMQSELESASSPDEAEEIEAVYARVAADRSQHPEQFMEYLQSLESGSGEAGAAPAEAAKPGKKVSKFQFRSGINDKRSWGEGRPADTASASSKQAEAAGSPAADTPVAPGAAAGSPPSADAASGAAAASDAAAEPGAAASSSSEASSAARSTARPASKALEAFDGFNPLKESQEAAFKRYESFAKTLAAESWSEMEGMKEHPEVAVLVKDLVRQIRSTTGDEKAEFNLEGLERMYQADHEMRADVLADAAEAYFEASTKKENTASAARKAGALRKSGPDARSTARR